MEDTSVCGKGVNNVALRLFEHNEKACRAAVSMMEQHGKVSDLKDMETSCNVRVARFNGCFKCQL